MRLKNIMIPLLFVAACGSETTSDDPNVEYLGGKADDFQAQRIWETKILDPHCDVCTNEDKNYLLETSPIISKVISMIDAAETKIDVAQFTFSRKEIEAALIRAHERGIDIRMAMNHQQAQGDNVSTRLKEAGLDVRFIKGKNNGSYDGLQHAKFMLVDDTKLLMGSNNWSSTGTSFNEENTVVLTSDFEDPILASFRCGFNGMFESQLESMGACASDEAKFTPGTGPWKQIREDMRTAESTIDVLMHHLKFGDAVKEMAKAAERGVRVRLIVNEADRDEISGSNFDRLIAAGGEIRFKKTNQEAYQIMHHKLAIVDGKILLNGSGNWSGSAFFNNYEFYTRLEAPEVVNDFNALYKRLWNWSLSADSLDSGITAADQDITERKAYFGNLHAHFHQIADDHHHDDGKLERTDENGETIDVTEELEGRTPVRYALEYARDIGKLDFMALSPHTSDDRPEDTDMSVPNISVEKYAEMVTEINTVNNESFGSFVALKGFEWSTNSTGNHVNIIGANAPAKVERGAFKDFYEGYLPTRTEIGEKPMMILNHPRTFKDADNPTLLGSWDQVFDVNLLEIEKTGQRTKKFNDYGLDDYSPLKDVRQSWIEGDANPDRAVVAETMRNIAEVTKPYARMMEVTINGGNHLTSDSPQNPSLNEDPDTMELVRTTSVHTDWDYFLTSGFRISPIASHDNHSANWGRGHTSRTVIHATELTEFSLMEAMDERAVFASEDENLDIRFYAEERVRAGGEVRTLGNKVTIEWLLSDPDFADNFEVAIYFGTVGGTVRELTRFGEVEPNTAQSFDIEVDEIGEHFVYLEVLEPGPDRMAWSAPIWIVKER